MRFASDPRVWCGAQNTALPGVGAGCTDMGEQRKEGTQKNFEERGGGRQGRELKRQRNI